MHDHAPPHGIPRPEHDATTIPDAWLPEPEPADANGYNPGPELTATHNGVTLAIQRTHLTHVGASYYWEVRTEGTAIPLLDGVMTTSDPTTPLAEMARHLAWHYYSNSSAKQMTDTTPSWSVTRVWPATTRWPDAEQQAALHVIGSEAFG